MILWLRQTPADFALGFSKADAACCRLPEAV
jgi:hypothetical protein